MSSFPIERIDDIRSNPQNFRLLERVPLTDPNLNFPCLLSDPVGDEINVVFLDVETTGLTAGTDKIIELGIVTADYSPSAQRMTQVTGFLDHFEDPGFPIPPEITELTGITTEQVQGLRIDDNLVSSYLVGDPIIIAHNAKFDRKFFETRLPTHSNLRWACSCFDLDWTNKGLGGKSLTSLLAGEGYFFDAHRAATDCYATTWLFHVLPQYFSALINYANAPSVFLNAYGFPFDYKDLLKERGYRWDAANRVWGREVLQSDCLSELQFLDTVAGYSSARVQQIPLTARERHK